MVSSEEEENMQRKESKKAIELPCSRLDFGTEKKLTEIFNVDEESPERFYSLSDVPSPEVPLMM